MPVLPAAPAADRQSCSVPSMPGTLRNRCDKPLRQQGFLAVVFGLAQKPFSATPRKLLMLLGAAAPLRDCPDTPVIGQPGSAEVAAVWLPLRYLAGSTVASSPQDLACKVAYPSTILAFGWVPAWDGRLSGRTQNSGFYGPQNQDLKRGTPHFGEAVARSSDPDAPRRLPYPRLSSHLLRGNACATRAHFGGPNGVGPSQRRWPHMIDCSSAAPRYRMRYPVTCCTRIGAGIIFLPCTCRFSPLRLPCTSAWAERRNAPNR